MDLDGFIKVNFYTKTAKQTIVLYSSQVLIIVLGLIIQVVNTRYLGPVEFGVLSFCISVMMFSSNFIGFGLFQSIARLLAIRPDERRNREYVGCAILLSIACGILYALIIYGLSFHIDVIFKTNVGSTLRFIAPISLVYPLQNFIRSMCMGSNKIKKLSFYLSGMYLLHLSFLVVLVLSNKFTVGLSILVNLVAMIISASTAYYSFNPLFSNLRVCITDIIRETKSYGFHTYLSSLVSMSSSQMTEMVISFFISTTALGFYSLSISLTKPITMFSQSLSTSIFKKLATRDKISMRVITLNLVWLSLTCCGLILVGKYLILLFFSNKYLQAASIIMPIAMMAFFNGLSQPYNIFLSAKGSGVYLKRIAVYVSVFNIIMSFAVIPEYGLAGAAYVTMFTQLSGFLLHRHYYTLLIKRSVG